jgi:MFS family permease
MVPFIRSSVAAMSSEAQRVIRLSINPVLAPVTALLLSVVILVSGNGLQSTLLPVRAAIEKFDTIEIGLMGSAYYLGFVLGCLWGGQLIERVGHIRAFTALASIASTVALLHAVAVEPLTWALLRAVTGFCFAGLYVVIETWLNDKVDNHNRGFVMGAYTMITLWVMVVGQLLLTLDDPQHFPLFAIASILVSLAAVPVALTRSPQPAPLYAARVDPLRLFRVSPVGAVGVCIVGLVTGAFWALGPAFAASVGADVHEIAVFMAIASLGGALVQWPLGRLSDRIDRRLVLIGGCLVAVGAAIGIFFFSSVGDWRFFLFSGLFGAAALPLYAICAANAFDFVDRAKLVEISSGLLLLHGIGSIIGPLIAAAAMEGIGPRGLFVSTAVGHAALAAYAIWRIRQRGPLTQAERTGFDLVSTAPTMTAIDPAATAESPAAPGPASAQASAH